jgi:hypothetical protein
VNWLAVAGLNQNEQGLSFLRSCGLAAYTFASGAASHQRKCIVFNKKEEENEIASWEGVFMLLKFILKSVITIIC